MKWFPSWDLTVMKLLTLAVLSQEYPGKNNSKVNTMAADGLAPRAARSSPATIWVGRWMISFLGGEYLGSEKTHNESFFFKEIQHIKG